ncbi:MAG TPA: AAA family ATPase [Gemmataceae bacterium]|jgi:hypothetical protein
MTASATNGTSFRSATAARPCPVCDGKDGCSEKSDGLILCRRRQGQQPGFRCLGPAKGDPAWTCYRREGDPGPDRSANGRSVPIQAEPDVLNAVYGDVLRQLNITTKHSIALQERGLKANVMGRGYRSLPHAGLPRYIVDGLRKQFGDKKLLRVPGFAWVDPPRGRGRRSFRFFSSPGLLIPVRDVQGRIVALKVRRDCATSNKYLYVSSAKYDGPGPGAPPHVPLGLGPKQALVRLTEGELKADIATELSGVPTIASPGMNWQTCLPVLKAMDAETVRLAYDADAATNPNVGKKVAECFDGLRAAGYEVEFERWAAAYGKGIDDVLSSGHQTEVLSGDDAAAAVRGLAGAPAAPTPTFGGSAGGVNGDGPGALRSDDPIIVRPDEPAEAPAAEPLPNRGDADETVRQGDRGTVQEAHPPKFPAPIPSSQLRARDDDTLWRHDGYLATDGITMLSALWKAGKSTYLGYRARAFEADGTFCGRPVKASKVLHVSEESESVLAMRRDKIGIGDHVHNIIRPFVVKPRFGEWIEFINYLRGVLVDFPADVVVFDTISNLWPVRNENDAAEVQAALMPLRAISEGRSLEMVHHAGKADAGQATASRGSGALAAFVDIIVELRRFNADDKDDRRRVLTGYGRYDATPAELVIELTVGGYVAQGDKAEAVAKDVAEVLRGILPTIPPGMTHKEIEENWPAEAGARKQVLLATLRFGAEKGWWGREGTGKKGDPYRYWQYEG